ncbi:uncharacterized protein TRIVIDRAFT_222108 [Trichoderma virens Gv29-8]|uniref:Uncharacterized protein n=1 Tax=Hypocrea virens (strain Gv29-8 / FGSC 10586) TaxID=413071 RepID=G9MRX7_HYPVG|nr:uncharacterized protein TRIVIDRAFT_222108 [Trichoderma virens Gv29-8]EHK22845.1 hypothetical protein TRIVIDRAFT_222108 [Trichoderma virens Gv29-8]
MPKARKRGRGSGAKTRPEGFVPPPTRLPRLRPAPPPAPVRPPTPVPPPPRTPPNQMIPPYQPSPTPLRCPALSPPSTPPRRRHGRSSSLPSTPAPGIFSPTPSSRPPRRPKRARTAKQPADLPALPTLPPLEPPMTEWKPMYKWEFKYDVNQLPWHWQCCRCGMPGMCFDTNLLCLDVNCQHLHCRKCNFFWTYEDDGPFFDAYFDWLRKRDH